MGNSVTMAHNQDVTKTVKLLMDGSVQRSFYNLLIVFQIMSSQHTAEMGSTLLSLENNVMMETQSILMVVQGNVM